MFASKFLTAIICYTTFHVDRSSLCHKHTRLVGAVIDSYWWKCFPIGFSSPCVWSVWHPVCVQQHFAATTSSHGNVLIMGRPGECAYHGEAKGRGRVITQGGQGRGWWLTAVLHARQLFPFVCSAISWWLCPKTWAGNDLLLRKTNTGIDREVIKTLDVPFFVVEWCCEMCSLLGLWD